MSRDVSLVAAEAAATRTHPGVHPMTRREFAFMIGLIVVGIPAGVAVIWLLDQAAGTSWALPVGACVLLLAFLVDFGAGKVRVR